MRVRRLAERDRVRWAQLFNDYIDFYRASVPQAVIDLTWQRLLAPETSDLIGLVAVDDDEAPIGLAHILFHQSTWSATSYCYLEDLYVDGNRRGEGAGRALIAATYAEADARNCTRTYWMTDAGNQTARRLYDQLAVEVGMVQYRRLIEGN